MWDVNAFGMHEHDVCKPMYWQHATAMSTQVYVAVSALIQVLGCYWCLQDLQWMYA